MMNVEEDDGFTTSDAELDSEVESDYEFENDLGSWLDQLDSGHGGGKQNGAHARTSLKQPVTLTPKQVMDSFRCSVLEGGGDQDVDLDAILGELCELETQLSSQQTEINDSLTKTCKQPAPYTANVPTPGASIPTPGVGIPTPGVGIPTRGARHRTTSSSSNVSSSEVLSSSWDTDIHSQLQDALSELTDLCGPSSPRDCDFPDSGTASSPRVSMRNVPRSPPAFNKPMVSAKPKMTPPKPAVLPKPCKPPVLPPDPKPPNGVAVHYPGLDRLESQDLTSESVDTDSAFSDTVSLPSSGSHVSVTGSHHSGSSQGSGGSGGSDGSSGLGTCTSAGTLPVMEQGAESKAEKVRIAMEKIKDSNLKKLFVRVYSADGSSKSILVDENMTVAQVCDMLVVKNHVKPKVAWGIIEVMPELYMERMMEDNEYLVENLLLWTKDSANKLMFAERPDKYDVFYHPELYLLSEKDVASYSECDKRALIEEFFSETNARVPELEGMMCLKSEGKKAWKRYYFVLRASGLYYNPKGKGKSSKDLVCLQKLDFVELYLGLGWKKKYKAPTDFCFALKHPQIQKKASKYIRYLCVDDHKTWAQWVTCIRIIKNGSQMWTNCTSAQNNVASWDTRDVFGNPSLPDYLGDQPIGVNGNVALEYQVIQNGVHPGMAAVTTHGHRSSFSEHPDDDEDGMQQNDENENVPTKMLPILPVTTQTTKAITQQQPTHVLKKSPQTLRRMKQSTSSERIVDRDIPPPPAPAFMGSTVNMHAALPPPPSPNVLEALQTEVLARASTARQSLRRVSSSSSAGSIGERSHNSVPASPVRVAPRGSVGSITGPTPGSPRAFSAPDPMAPPAGIAEAVGHRRTSSGPPSTPPINKGRVPPPPLPKRSETTKLMSQPGESPHTTPQHRPHVPAAPTTPQHGPSVPASPGGNRSSVPASPVAQHRPSVPILPGAPQHGANGATSPGTHQHKPLPAVPGVPPILPGAPQHGPGVPPILPGAPQHGTGVPPILPGAPQHGPGVPPILPGAPQHGPGVPPILPGAPQHGPGVPPVLPGGPGVPPILPGAPQQGSSPAISPSSPQRKPLPPVPGTPQHGHSVAVSPSTPQHKPCVVLPGPPHQGPGVPASPSTPQHKPPVVPVAPQHRPSVPASPSTPQHRPGFGSAPGTPQHRPSVPPKHCSGPASSTVTQSGAASPQDNTQQRVVGPPPTPPKPSRPGGGGGNLMADLQRVFQQKQSQPQGTAGGLGARSPSPPPPPMPQGQQHSPTGYNSDLPPPPAELLEGLQVVKKKPPPPPPKRTK